MAKEYAIDVTEDAKADLDEYPASAKKSIVTAIREQLTHQPTVQTRNRKKLREHKIAPWELRCGEFRVFYTVDEEAAQVTVIAVGRKTRQKLYVRGKEVEV